MFLIKCPYCGERDQAEFSCGGEAHIARPKNPPDLTIYGSTIVIKDELEPITDNFYNSLEKLKELITVIPHVFRQKKGKLHRQKRFPPVSGGKRRKSRKRGTSPIRRRDKKIRIV